MSASDGNHLGPQNFSQFHKMSQCPTQPARRLAEYLPYQRQRAQEQASAVGSFEQADISLDARRTDHRCLTNGSPNTDTRFTLSDMQQLMLPSETFEIAGVSAQCDGDPTTGHSSYLADLKAPEAQPRFLPINDFTGRLSAVGDRLERVIEVAIQETSRGIERIARLEAQAERITDSIDALLCGTLPGGESVGHGNR
ncbi:hypothetical protein CDEST_02105 [Colletotrichum destructivum]|uniref:Uncharacterized protein n=1 Tax=Colletotrichum destructivum TaxID=34406 RepID=A0AAX4I159_9PEZI|nr:hypothetical protein CDEST_02105 [Colletotrichum destructivum]